MKRWQRLEEVLDTYDFHNSTLTNEWLAAELNVSTQMASQLITAYQVAQRGVRSQTAYVLKRLPGTRTTNAEWTVGQRGTDAGVITKTFSDDVKRKFQRQVEPDLHALTRINPRAQERVDILIGAIAEGAVKMLEIAVAPSEWQSDES